MDSDQVSEKMKRKDPFGADGKAAKRNKRKPKDFNEDDEEPLIEMDADQETTEIPINNDQLVQSTNQKRRDRDARCLYIRAGTVKTVEINKLKELADGIIDVRRHEKAAYLEFETERETDKAYKKLKGTKLDEEDLYVDYVGEKSQYTKTKKDSKATSASSKDDQDRDRRCLYIRANTVKTADLDEMMKIAAGIVDVRRKGKSAYVEFQNEDEAEKGYKQLQSYKLDGEVLYVDFVGGKSKVTEKVGVKEMDPLKLYIGGLPEDATKVDILELFPKAMNVKMEKTIQGKHKFAFAFFDSAEDAKEGFSRTNVKIHGKPLNILYAKTKKEKRS